MSLSSISGVMVAAALAISLTTEKGWCQNALEESRNRGNAFKLSTTRTGTLWVTARHVANRDSKAVGVRGCLIADGDRVLHAKFEAAGDQDDWSAWSTPKAAGDVFKVSDSDPAWFEAHRGTVAVSKSDRIFPGMIAFTPAPDPGDSGCALTDAAGDVVGVVIGSTNEQTPVGIAIPIGVVLDGLFEAGIIPTTSEDLFGLR